MDFNAWSSELVVIVQSAQRMADRLNMNLVIDEQKANEFASTIPSPSKPHDTLNSFGLKGEQIPR